MSRQKYLVYLPQAEPKSKNRVFFVTGLPEREQASFT
jgi:hypothetical protein